MCIEELILLVAGTCNSCTEERLRQGGCCEFGTSLCYHNEFQASQPELQYSTRQSRKNITKQKYLLNGQFSNLQVTLHPT